MEAEQFREFGKAAVDYVANYFENIRDFDVLSSVQPGYLSELIPQQMPEGSEDWKVALEDIDRAIIPGIIHWQSPNFHGFHPSGTSYPSIVAETISAGFGIVGFSWMTSPACTELEVIVMDWLAKFLNLPQLFLSSHAGPGGGFVQGSSCDAILIALLAAREQTVKRYSNEHPEIPESVIRGKLVGYSSDQCNSYVKKVGLLAVVPIKLISTGEDFTINATDLEAAIAEDLADGKIPIFFVANTGSIGTCAYDDLATLGPICAKYNIWLHVDAIYAGMAFCLPECKDLLNKLEYADSLNIDLDKGMLVNDDCTAMWLKNPEKLKESFTIDRIYLKHKFELSNSRTPDFLHWEIPLGRRFRALKIWITLRTYGAKGIRTNVRRYFELSKQFEKYVRNDERFEIVGKPSIGLVCFRLKGDNWLTENLLNQIIKRKKIFMNDATHMGKIFLRFSVAGFEPKSEDIQFAWNEISEQANILLNGESVSIE